MACYLSLGVIKKKTTTHNNHKLLFAVNLLPQKTLDQTQAVHLLQKSIGLFYSCGATGVLRRERDTVWFSRNRGIEQSVRATREAWKEIFTREEVPGCGRG